MAWYLSPSLFFCCGTNACEPIILLLYNLQPIIIRTVTNYSVVLDRSYCLACGGVSTEDDKSTEGPFSAKNAFKC